LLKTLLKTLLRDVAGKPVAAMVSAFEERRNYVVERLKQIPGVKLAEPRVGFTCCLEIMCMTYGHA
jgi:aspartate/methionine/tyrosine aminotransferase